MRGTGTKKNGGYRAVPWDKYGDVSFGGAMESFNKAVPRKEGYPALGGTFDWPRKGSSGHGFGREFRDPI